MADQLLTVKGIQAVFIIGEDGARTVISARSLGKINVQLIMERFNGGGHLTAAAAQVTMTKEEVEEKILKIVEEMSNDRNS